MTSSILITVDQRGIATLMLNRPHKHNALNAELIGALHAQLIELEQDTQVRVVVLTGAGDSFSAGGDLEHMQLMSKANDADNFSDAINVARCLRKLNEFPKPVIARVNGNAFGGGVGLICCADIAIATQQARFCLSEVRVGLTAATISPYLIAAIGTRQTRRLLLTAASLDAIQALSIGLLHDAVDAQQLDTRINQEVDLLLMGGPEAQRASKQLLREVVALTSEEHDLLMAKTARTLARLRTSPEGREGLQAFLDKRKPHWSR